MRTKESVPDVRSKREQWKAEIAELDKNNLVFLDESGVNINMTRLYGRAKGKKRVVDTVPLNTPKTTTVLSSIRKSGERVYICYSGGATKERFKEYLVERLIPSLKPNDIIVMDNMRTHHAKAVTALLDEKHIQYRYIPPYSPDMNPIEKMWSKMKSGLRKIKMRSAEHLSEAVQSALDMVTIDNCSAWFRLIE